MTGKARLAALVSVVLLAAQAADANPVPDLCTAGGWVLQEQCSPLLYLRGGSSTCCSTLRGLQDLGCFCNTDYSHQIPSLDLWNVRAFCGLEADGDRLCSPNRSGENVESAPEEQTNFQNELDLLSAANKQGESVDYRPVLDLSSMPDSVTTIFQRSSNGQVTIRYSEKVDSNGDSTLSVDVDMPEATDLDIDLEYSMQSQESDKLFINSDLFLEGLTVEGSDSDAQSAGLETAIQDIAVEEILAEGLAKDASLAKPCHQLPAVEKETGPQSMELTVFLPEGFLEAFNDSDVNIDMEFDPEGEGSFSSAAITLDDGVLESSFNGKAIGSLLKEAAQYLSTELSLPLPTSFSGQEAVQIGSKSMISNKGSLLRGALGFLATVGEDIRDSIPDKQLHDGDVIQIQHDAEATQLREESKPQPASNQSQRPLVKLSEAVELAMRHTQGEKQASWNGACTVCELVHKYISALWAIVIAGFAVLAYCAVTASIKAFSEPAPTDPNADLQQPLIVSAADYVKGKISSDALILPVWSPPKPLH